MNTEKIKEIQTIVYKILKDINVFCKEEQIIYMLSGGTCLGAIRENGFIPWDDDADIMMSRSNYMFFLKEFSKRYHGKYMVSSLYTDEYWERPYAKVWDIHTRVTQKKSTEKDTGIGIDVFPIDAIPNELIKKHMWINHLKLLNIMRNSARRYGFYDGEKFKSIKNMLGYVTRKKGARYYSEKMDKIASSYGNSDCRYVGAVMALNYWEKEFIRADLLNGVVDKKFVDDIFPVPIGYDRYLSNLYGDYMMPPRVHIDHGDVQMVELQRNK